MIIVRIDVHLILVDERESTKLSYRVLFRSLFLGNQFL